MTTKLFITAPLLFGWLQKNKGENNGCSVFGVVNKNGVLVGRNYDFFSACEKYSCLYSVKYQQKKYNSFTAISDMGIWQIGAEPDPSFFVLTPDDAWSKNLYVSLNGAPEIEWGYGLSAPHLLQLLIEKCQTTTQAVKIIRKAPVLRSIIFTIIDKNGDMAVAEKAGQNNIKIRRSDKFIYTTNHYNHPDFVKYNEKIFKTVPFHATFGRYHYLRVMLEKYKSKMDIGLIMDILAKPPALQNWRGKDQGDSVTVWTLALNLAKQKYALKFSPLTKKYSLLLD